MWHFNGITKSPLEFYLPMLSTIPCRFPVFKPVALGCKLSPNTLGMSIETESMGKGKAFQVLSGLYLIQRHWKMDHTANLSCKGCWESARIPLQLLLYEVAERKRLMPILS